MSGSFNLFPFVSSQGTFDGQSSEAKRKTSQPREIFDGRSIDHKKREKK